MLIHCDRCKRKVEGDFHERFTCGFYDVSLGCWRKYARNYETIICDECMHADPQYIQNYGVTR